jgi:hypothetical protein
MDRQEVLEAARTYLRRHPTELGRIVRSAFGLRLGVPLDALRWLADQASKSGKARDIQIDAVPPGFRVAATVDLMGTMVRAGAVVYVERVVVNGHEMRVEIRLEEVRLTLVEDSDSSVALLIKSGALDLSKPGNLVKHVPNLPPFLVEARDKKIVLDFIRHPAIARNPTARAAVELLTSIMTVHGVETDEGHLDVAFRALPAGVFAAARNVRQHLVLPGLRRARLLLPGR